VATPLKQVLDYDDYAAIPPDGKRYELLDPVDRRLESFRRVGTTWQPALDGEGDAVLTHFDWPDLTLRLAELWM
jgi:hypothetical protein